MIKGFGRILVLPNFFAAEKRMEQVEQTAKRYKTISESTAFMVMLTLLSGYLNAYTSVSYTHLDVYKRQGYAGAHGRPRIHSWR